VHPNSITTIPGRVRVTVDIRDVDSDRQRRLASTIAQRAADIASARGATVAQTVIGDTSPAVLPAWIRRVIADVCEDAAVRYKVLSCGAGHDAQLISRVIPAGIIFVPSRRGLSHVPEEWTTSTQIATGARVLLGSAVRLDRMLSELEAGHPA
jgi:allantoate deiminase